jgi:hypothetical protein
MGRSSQQSSQAVLETPRLLKSHPRSACSQGQRTNDKEIQSEADRLGGPRVENASRIVEDSPLLKWNAPRINIWRTLAAFLGLFIMGANDAAFGVQHSIPSYDSQLIFLGSDSLCKTLNPRTIRSS